MFCSTLKSVIDIFNKFFGTNNNQTESHLSLYNDIPSQLLQDIPVNSNNKLVELFYNNSVLYYGTEKIKHSSINELIYKTFEIFLQDETLKYFMYFNALEDDRDKIKKNHLFCYARSECYQKLWQKEYITQKKVSIAQYVPSDDLIKISFDPDMSYYPSFVAHEILHRTYDKKYHNFCKPHAAENSTSATQYNQAYKETFKDLAQFHSLQKNEATKLEKFKQLIYNSVVEYHEYKQGAELIAWCQQFQFHTKLHDNMNEEICPSINKYVKDYVIPDLINHIEYHRNCSEIAKYDSSINCVVGETNSNEF